MTTRDRLFARAAAPLVRQVDADGTPIHVRPLTLAEADELRQKVLARPEADRDTEATVQFVLYGVCDEAGRRQFTEADRPQIMGWEKRLLAAIADAVGDANKYDKAAAKKG